MIFKKNTSYLAIVLILSLFSTILLSAEFPNYFLSKNATAQEEALVKEALENATASILERMIIPVVDESGSITYIRALTEFTKMAKQIDQDSSINAAGGVIRSIFGKLYEEIYNAKEEDPKISALDVLDRIAKESNDIMYTDVIGGGSDLDFFIVSPGNMSDAISNKIDPVINGAINSASGSDVAESTKRMIYPRGDLKDYFKQTQRAASQGGSVLDWIAFDFITKKFREPEARNDHGSIIENLIHGKVEYLAPLPNIKVDPALQLTRASRSLTELPFVDYTDESEKLMLKDIEKVLNNSESFSANASTKVFQQLDKLTRNSRFCGGGNRFYKARPDSFEEKFLEYTQKLSTKTNTPTIPLFADMISIVKKRRDTKDMPKDLLMNADDFIKKYTDSGTLYHGTPSVESALSIYRGGFFVSDESVNDSLMKNGDYLGRGVYTTKDVSMATDYYAKNGLTFGLQLIDGKEKEHINVLDWKKVKSSPWIINLENKTNKTGQELFETLAKEYGVDIIINDHVLVQNTGVIKPMKSIEDLLGRSILLSDNASDEEILKVLNSYKIFAQIVNPNEPKLWNRLLNLSKNKKFAAPLAVILSYSSDSKLFSSILNSISPEILAKDVFPFMANSPHFFVSIKELMKKSVERKDGNTLSILADFTLPEMVNSPKFEEVVTELMEKAFEINDDNTLSNLAESVFPIMIKNNPQRTGIITDAAEKAFKLKSRLFFYHLEQYTFFAMSDNPQLPMLIKDSLRKSFELENVGGFFDYLAKNILTRMTDKSQVTALVQDVMEEYFKDESIRKTLVQDIFPYADRLDRAKLPALMQKTMEKAFVLKDAEVFYNLKYHPLQDKFFDKPKFDWIREAAELGKEEKWDELEKLLSLHKIKNNIEKSALIHAADAITTTHNHTTNYKAINASLDVDDKIKLNDGKTLTVQSVVMDGKRGKVYKTISDDGKIYALKVGKQSTPTQTQQYIIEDWLDDTQFNQLRKQKVGASNDGSCTKIINQILSH